SSYTVSITGNSSVLHTRLFPALNLTKEREWEAALLDFTTYNSIPNITEKVNNKLHIYKGKDENTNYTSPEVIELPTGSYEIEDINKELQKKLGKENINIVANNNLLKVEITSKHYIDFTKDHSIGSMLGFPSTSDVLEPGKTHTGSRNVDIIKIST
ncbi:hypothetical protein, partial [Klebsiella pneumoniae]|uniref:hypothetical protein n=1 Tax=Klebsiella pneumoniae TaxID=573 RepID=UPI00163D9B3C